MKPIHTPEYTRMRERLKEARKAAGMTQKQVAKELDRPQSFVSKVETGERRIDPTDSRRSPGYMGSPSRSSWTAKEAPR